MKETGCHIVYSIIIYRDDEDRIKVVTLNGTLDVPGM